MSHDWGPASLSVRETAELLRKHADDRIGALLERTAASGSPSRCRAGCDACCHQLVMVTPMEAHAIDQYLDTHPNVRSGLDRGLEAWRGALAEHPELAAGLDDLAAAGGYPEEEDGGRLEEVYWSARLPCPFLASGHCTIYPVRPFSCREHHVVSAPELCQIELDRPEPAGTRLEHRTLAAYIGSTVYFLPDILMPLPLAPAYAEANRDEAGREADEDQVYDAAEEGQERLSAAFRRLGIEPPFG